MSDEDLDLESYWKDIRVVPPRVVDRKNLIHEQLEAANERASERLREWGVSSVVGSRPQSEVVSKAVSLFMEEWQQGLRQMNLSGLIGIVLEGQDLSPTEIKGFVQALPTSLLKRVCESVITSATGTHGLMAFEYARREHGIRGYEVLYDGSKIRVDVTELTDRKISFYLDEEFKELNATDGSKADRSGGVLEDPSA